MTLTHLAGLPRTAEQPVTSRSTRRTQGHGRRLGVSRGFGEGARRRDQGADLRDATQAHSPSEPHVGFRNVGPVDRRAGSSGITSGGAG